MSEGSGERPLRVAQWVRIRWWNACAYYAVSLAEGLARIGHESFVLAPKGTPAYEEAKTRGLRVPEIGDPGSSRPDEWLRSGRALRRFLEDEAIDVVNVHSGPGHARLSRLRTQLGFRVVRTRGDIRPPRTGSVQRWLYRDGTDHHLVSADFLRAPYDALGVPESRITTLRGGTDLARTDQVDREAARRAVRERLGLSPDQPLIGMIARLSPVKGHDVLLRAMAELRVRHPRAHLVCAGGNAQLTREQLERMAHEIGVGPRVHFVGRVEDPLEWAAALDVAVIASTGSEAICRSAFEYLAVRVPIVASRIHAVGEVLEGDVARLVPPASVIPLADALSGLLANADERVRLAEKGRAHVEEHYSLERFGASAAAVFRQLAQSRPSTGPRRP
ncbi:MAG: glycosyltransferase family 4 protein [Candidatus Eisenbacteria bacterium]|uniref:Glycosyltransferase family 4 protein n=1 Tax=Eiseniibacteriota bacterium TaxID=2212470 RepID=A0A956N7R5_UNCEI|nr:glycosyltransferase family 4 protein [Candidatus Eisenbacteria bacterium]MCB9462281.1 glycosyltransferase family 4 protein [Candidatus Eisenbacteria bacterium]